MQINFWDLHKKFGPAKNIFGPVEAQGIRKHNGFIIFGQIFGNYKYSDPVRSSSLEEYLKMNFIYLRKLDF